MKRRSHNGHNMGPLMYIFICNFLFHLGGYRHHSPSSSLHKNHDITTTKSGDTLAVNLRLGYTLGEDLKAVQPKYTTLHQQKKIS